MSPGSEGRSEFRSDMGTPGSELIEAWQVYWRCPSTTQLLRFCHTITTLRGTSGTVLALRWHHTSTTLVLCCC